MKPWKLALFPACALTAGVLAAWAAPAQWKGELRGTRVDLFVDGQKATGGVHAAFPKGTAELTLSGSGTGARYTGTMTGRGQRGNQPVSMAGSWEAVLSSGRARIQLQVRPHNGEPVRLEVPLSPSEYQPLRCSWVQGTATRRSGTAASRLQAGDGLQVGDAVETGPASSAIVILGDRSVVMMQELTRVEVPNLPDNQSQVQRVKVSSGKVWFAVRKVQQGDKFEVETAEAVAAVRGTEFLVEFEDEKDLRLTTAEGEVAVTDPEGREAAVPVRAGMAWSQPRRAPAGLRRPWRPAVKADLGAVVGRWRPMLEEADRHWPFRRLGKGNFWQNRFGKPQPPGPRPPAAPGGLPRGGPRDRPGTAAAPVGRTPFRNGAAGRASSAGASGERSHRPQLLRRKNSR